MSNEVRKYQCCFTGHRPEKLCCDEKTVKAKLRTEIKRAIRDGYTTFIVGMCRGTDLWAGEIVLEERQNNPELRLIAAIPHPNFESNRNKVDKMLYFKILENADEVNTISNKYHKFCYQKRNAWMVDRSSRVIAAYNGDKGGTKNTIDYAKKQDIDIINIFDEMKI